MDTSPRVQCSEIDDGTDGWSADVPVVPDPVFYEAQAVVLCNMGNHKQALMIYVFRMEDYAKAEE